VTASAPPLVDAVSRGYVQRSWGLMQLAEYAIGLTPTDSVVGPVEHVMTAERVRVHTTDVAMISVMLDRARGAKWTAIARARRIPADEAEALYAPLYDRWLAGESYPWHPPGATNMPTACPDDLVEAVRQVNEWYLRVCGPLGRAGYRRAAPVSILARA
jgi:hypothetical protein